MKKNVILATAFTLLLLVSASFAQDKTANYLGKWQLDASKSKLTKVIAKGIESQTLNVSQDGDDFIVETNTQTASADDIKTRTEIYRTTESVQTALVGARFGGYTTQQLVFRKKGKLELRSAFKGDVTNNSIKETWSLSEDGQTLTIKRISTITFGRAAEAASNMYTTWVFAKQ
jgi:hypothetical protein